MLNEISSREKVTVATPVTKPVGKTQMRKNIPKNYDSINKSIYSSIIE